MQGHLLLTNCIEDEVTRPAIEQALKERSLLWLNLADTGPDTIALLREVFKIHPLAVEDAQEFDQRPKVEDYDDFVYIVAYGARGLDQRMVEVHCFYAENYAQAPARGPAQAGHSAAGHGVLHDDPGDPDPRHDRGEREVHP